MGFISIDELHKAIRECLFKANYIDCDPNHQYVAQSLLQNVNITTRPIYATEIQAGKNIYGSTLKLDYLLINPSKNKQALAVVAKFQKDKGTVDEKFPFLVANIKSRYPCPTIVILEGGGYRPGAEQWLKDQRDYVKLLEVFSFKDFAHWAEDGGL